MLTAIVAALMAAVWVLPWLKAALPAAAPSCLRALQMQWTACRPAPGTATSWRLLRPCAQSACINVMDCSGLLPEFSFCTRTPCSLSSHTMMGPPVMFMYLGNPRCVCQTLSDLPAGWSVCADMMLPPCCWSVPVVNLAPSLQVCVSPCQGVM